MRIFVSEQVLLKNSMHSNITAFRQVLMEKEWTPEVINKRQEQLIHQLEQVWCLQ